MAEHDFNELWGTFSVFDHMKGKPFLAEVLLYDKLVIPVRPEKPTKTEAERWDQWRPKAQEKILEILGENRVDRVEWTDYHHEMWKTEWEEQPSKLAEQKKRELAGELTALLLSRGSIPDHAKPVVAVSPYRSWSKLEKDLKIKPGEPGRRIRAGQTISTVVARELMIPDDLKFNDMDLLREAVRMTDNPDYKKKRHAFHAWQQKFLAPDGFTDKASVEAALKQMSDLVADLQRVTARRKLWKGVRRVAFAAQLALTVPFATIPILAVGNAALAIGSFTASERLDSLKKDEPSAASLACEVRRGFRLGRLEPIELTR